MIQSYIVLISPLGMTSHCSCTAGVPEWVRFLALVSWLFKVGLCELSLCVCSCLPWKHLNRSKKSFLSLSIQPITRVQDKPPTYTFLQFKLDFFKPQHFQLLLQKWQRFCFENSLVMFWNTLFTEAFFLSIKTNEWLIRYQSTCKVSFTDPIKC